MEPADLHGLRRRERRGFDPRTTPHRDPCLTLPPLATAYEADAFNLRLRRRMRFTLVRLHLTRWTHRACSSAARGRVWRCASLRRVNSSHRPRPASTALAARRGLCPGRDQFQAETGGADLGAVLGANMGAGPDRRTETARDAA